MYICASNRWNGLDPREAIRRKLKEPKDPVEQEAGAAEGECFEEQC